MNLKLYKKCIINPLPDNKYELLEPMVFNDVKIPKGFITNGANIPRIFWWIWPPNRSDYMPAIILHDYLCNIGEWKKADKYFREYMKLLKVETITIKIFYFFVKWFHKLRGKY